MNVLLIYQDAINYNTYNAIIIIDRVKLTIQI